MIAAGTVANAISDSFDASAALEIFSLDLDSASGEMPLLGSAQTSERFHRLAWGVGGVDSGSLPYGMLAGGLVDGTVKVYNPAAMIGCARDRAGHAAWPARPGHLACPSAAALCRSRLLPPRPG